MRTQNYRQRQTQNYRQRRTKILTFCNRPEQELHDSGLKGCHSKILSKQKYGNSMSDSMVIQSPSHFPEFLDLTGFQISLLYFFKSSLAGLYYIYCLVKTGIQEIKRYIHVSCSVDIVRERNLRTLIQHDQYSKSTSVVKLNFRDYESKVKCTGTWDQDFFLIFLKNIIKSFCFHI